MELSCDHTCPLSEQTHLGILSFLLTLHHLTSEGTQAQRRSPAPLCKCLYVEWDKSQSMDSSVKKIEFCPETGLTSTLNLFCPWKGRNLSLGQMASPPLCVCLGGGSIDQEIVTVLSSGFCLPWMVLGEGDLSPCRLLAHVPSHQTPLQKTCFVLILVETLHATWVCRIPIPPP